ncbi:MAG: aromatic aminobenezylarsenical efflux permease ArsG family transporter [Candidatus Sumerlaea chitinivorans]|nr:aromatic aminobenezylarsenical efflux permease ArsG family transporter [Candidatus Sumerlaea chitinivorans]
METGIWVSLLSSLWFGILTSISPCPLATNIAAMSYIAKEAHRPAAVLTRALLYAVGRLAAYVILAVIVVTGLLSVPSVARFLERNMNLIIGPLLILVALFLFDVIQLSGPSVGAGVALQNFVKKARWLGPLILGFVFALTFCPVSAGLFFGSLIPLAVQSESRLLVPGIYGVGTALPVAGFAVILSLGVATVASAFQTITKVEFWARRITGAIFVLAGIYLIIRNWPLYVQLFTR